MRKRRWGIGFLGSIVVTALLLWAYGSATRSGPFAEDTEEIAEFLSGRVIAENNGGTEDVFWLYDRSTDETFSLTAKELLPAAIACEMDLDCPQEALKAQAVACYTLFCRKRANGEMIACDREQSYVWTDEEHLRQLWEENYESCMAQLLYIWEQVAGEVLTYEGEPILAAYTAITPGCTEDGTELYTRQYPYLTAVASPGDCFSEGYLSIVTMSEEEVKAAATEAGIALHGESDSWLRGITYTNSGNVQSAMLGEETVSGQQLRSILGLRSAAITVERKGSSFVFTVRGSGHGVGMSQAGAIFLAKRGMGYEEILGYYYSTQCEISDSV